MELDLLVDNIMDELPLDDKFGREVLEPPDFFGMYDWCGFNVRGNVFKIVLALAPVPGPVFCEGPGIYLEEKIVQLCHRIVLERSAIYIRISFWQCKFQICSCVGIIYRVRERRVPQASWGFSHRMPG